MNGIIGWLVRYYHINKVLRSRNFQGIFIKVRMHIFSQILNFCLWTILRMESPVLPLVSCLRGLEFYGLLLCQGLEKYYVCNPVTEDWKLLPPHQYYHGSDPTVVIAFDPKDNIESYFHIVVAIPLLGQPVVFFEIYSSQSNSWKRSSSDCLDLEDMTLIGGGFYMKGMTYWKTPSNDLLAFDVIHEVVAVLHVSIPPGTYGALTQIKDEISYVTAYKDCDDVLMLDIYGGMDMSLNRSVCINLGHKNSHQALEKDAFIDINTVLCRVLPCVNSGDDIVVICMTERIYLYHLSGQKVETLMTLGQLNPHGIFIPFINSLVMLHELKN